MLFSKKNREVKFEDMAHDQVPDIKELEASLDFLKSKPSDNSDNAKADETVKNPHNEKHEAKLSEGESETPAPVAATPVHASAQTEEVSINVQTQTVEQIVEPVKHAEVTIDPEASENDGHKEPDDSNAEVKIVDNKDQDADDVSDAVKEAQALMAQYEAKKASGELKIDEKRKYARSRFYHMPTNQAIIDISELEKNNGEASDDHEKTDADKKDEITDAPEVTPLKEEGELHHIVAAQVTASSALLTDSRDPETKEQKTSEKTTKMDFRNNALLQSESDTSQTEEKDVPKEGKKTSEEDESEDAEDKPVKKGPFTGETKIVKVPPRDIISEVEAKINTMNKLAPLAQLKNPLPHPKKHISRKMDFDLLPNKEQMCFDLEDLTGKDFFDVE
ncbi:MAG: hypothetical protein BWY61_01298 [Firmicutes bacterium ADurb.Bin354]|nr:MAG: hypothetical protein BWY61_01298 [Firmicutes bacterium ADurb.Bin354]